MALRKPVCMVQPERRGWPGMSHTKLHSGADSGLSIAVTAHRHCQDRLVWSGLVLGSGDFVLDVWCKYIERVVYKGHLTARSKSDAPIQRTLNDTPVACATKRSERYVA